MLGGAGGSSNEGPTNILTFLGIEIDLQQAMQLHLPEGKTQGPERTALSMGAQALALPPPVHLNVQAQTDITWCLFDGTSIPQLLSNRIHSDASGSWGADTLWGTLPMASVVSWDHQPE